MKALSIKLGQRIGAVAVIALVSGLLLLHPDSAKRQLATRDERIAYVTDLEGRSSNLTTLVDQGVLTLSANRLDFSDAHTTLVFGGDLPDRGPDSITLRRWLVDLKERYPSRVVLIWGNRDLNKLGLVRDLPLLRELRAPEYEQWLAGQLTAAGIDLPSGVAERRALLSTHNTAEHQVTWWMQSVGAANGLEFHREELSQIQGRTLTLQEAAVDFLQALDPVDGEYFRYLELGQFGEVRGSALFVHGGVTDENIGVVPGAPHRERDARVWISRLNEWGQRELAAFRNRASRLRPGQALRSNLIAYGDAIWDQSVRRVLAEHQSVVYPDRFKEDGNFRLPPTSVIRALQSTGIDTVVLGHSPSGNIPVPLRENGFLLLMADTSYAPEGGAASVQISGAGVEVTARTGAGTSVHYRTSASSISPVGQLANEYTLVGQSSDGRYVGYRYVNGYTLDEKIFTQEELAAITLRAPTYSVNEEQREHRRVLVEQLDRSHVRLFSQDEVLGGEVGGLSPGVPVVFSGASKFSFEDQSEAQVRQAVRSFLSVLDPRRVHLITGGTDHGVELIVHQVGLELGFKIYGFISQGTVPQELNPHLAGVTVGGAGWDDPLNLALQVAHLHEGLAVFIGGGGVVTRGIERAHALDVDFRLMSNIAGASQNLAATYPTRGFTNGAELEAVVRSAHPAYFRPLRIGVFTGSFDPPHSGHRNIVEGMIRQAHLDVVYVIPDSTSAYKPEMQSYAHRRRMVELMFADMPQVRLPSSEIEQSRGSGELWEVYRAVLAAHPSSELFGIMGTDTLRWYQGLPSEHHVEGVTLLVNLRDRAASTPADVGGANVLTVDLADSGISSTRVRAQLAAGQASQELPPSVRDYVSQNRLYTGAERNVSPSEVRAYFRQRGLQVVTFVGYSAAEYEDKPRMLRVARRFLSRLDPRRTLVNIGVTPDGIGAVYELARSMGFETVGIVSSQGRSSAASPFVGQSFYVQDETWGGLIPGTGQLSPTSQAIVESSDIVIGIGGGDVGGAELNAARELGRRTVFISADMNHDIAIRRAVTRGNPIPTDFSGPAEAAWNASICESEMLPARR